MLSHREIKDLKLNLLLQITKAINNNASVSEILQVYQNFLHNTLSISKLCLFINKNINASSDSDWECILQIGLKKNKKIEFEKELLLIKDIETLTAFQGGLSKEFDVVVPVYHKDMPLAYLLMGDVNPQKIGMSPTIQHLPFVQTLTNIIVVSIENKKLYKQTIQQAEINKEIELAKQVQSLLLPQHLPYNKNIKVVADYMPFSLIGGDYYDIIQLNNHEYIFCIADVSGKGISAALLMSNIQAVLRSVTEFTHNLKDIIIQLNKRIIENAKGEKFVSIFLGKINLLSRQLTYINAGHNPPILWRDNQQEYLEKGTTLLGFLEQLPYIDVTILEYKKNLLLFGYTDGITDFFDMFSIDLNKLTMFIDKYKNKSPLEIKKHIMHRIKQLQTKQNVLKDDIALLIIRCE
ncbi:MAG: serine/threonine-protein phosphatase [Bacteroidetes bacterium]|nr:MAG: serine/threonine-protein phosphatase [Bacteroidota bacterium]